MHVRVETTINYTRWCVYIYLFIPCLVPFLSFLLSIYSRQAFNSSQASGPQIAYSPHSCIIYWGWICVAQQTTRYLYIEKDGREREREMVRIPNHFLIDFSFSSFLIIVNIQKKRNKIQIHAITEDGGNCLQESACSPVMPIVCRGHQTKKKCILSITV